MSPWRGIDEALACLVCGYAQGGTTFFTGLLAAHPAIDGRFECGILAADTPGGIPDLPDRVRGILRDHWSVDDGVIADMAGQATFRDAYRVLAAASDLADPTVRLFDKSPDYVKQLPRLVEGTPVPIFVVVRDPRAVYASRLARRLHRGGGVFEPGQSVRSHPLAPDLDAFLDDYNRIHDLVRNAQAAHGDRVMVVQLERLIGEFERQRRRIFDHLGLDVPAEPFGDLSVRSRKVRSGLDRSVIDRYTQVLAPADCEEIIERTRPAAAFHFEG